MQVVFVGRLSGQTSVTDAAKNVLSGTTCKLKVAAAPVCTETDISWIGGELNFVIVSRSR